MEGQVSIAFETCTRIRPLFCFEFQERRSSAPCKIPTSFTSFWRNKPTELLGMWSYVKTALFLVSLVEWEDLFGSFGSFGYETSALVISFTVQDGGHVLLEFGSQDEPF